MIEVTELCKRFGETRAVDDISFTVEKGEVLGFLGPNGAGKTTLLADLLRELCGRGLRVGTLKHSGHEHEVEGEVKRG